MGDAAVTGDIDELTRAVAGQTVPLAFVRTVAERSGATALRWARPAGDGELTFSTMTWAEYGAFVARAAAGLRDAGIGPGDRVLLMLRNRPEFHVLDVAALVLGATPISIYTSSAPEQVRYLAQHSAAKLAVVEDPGFLARFLEVRHELPALGRLVVVDDPEDTRPADVTTYTNLLAHEPLDLVVEAETAQPQDLATVIYTSGTTGPPKGVRISHFNVAYTVESLRRAVAREDLPGKRLVSYLPMAHIAERMTSHYQGIVVGYDVTTCPEPSQIAAYARAVRPHILFGVPRVWEKIRAGVLAAVAADPEKAQRLAEGIAAAVPIAERKARGEATADELATLEFLDAVAFSTVRQLLGFDELDLAISGAAPIPQEVLEFFLAIGVPMSEIYGMSESSGPMTWEPYRVKPGTVGRAIPGCEIRLGEDGEVICRGGNVFDGYLDDPARTAEALVDGWLHSGDIGELDDEGYLRIVDRKKELIITAGGKNISPSNLEAHLKGLPLVGQACVVGDARPYLVALLVLDPEAAPVWARQHGLEGLGLAELATHPDVVAALEAGVAEVNATVSRVEQIKRFAVLGDEWLPDSEELTPTSKLKRRGVLAKYDQVIDSLYA